MATRDEVQHRIVARRLVAIGSEQGQFPKHSITAGGPPFADSRRGPRRHLKALEDQPALGSLAVSAYVSSCGRGWSGDCSSPPPPHKSVRAELLHTAPALSHDATSVVSGLFNSCRLQSKH